MQIVNFINFYFWKILFNILTDNILIKKKRENKEFIIY
jgi:hypothetical protein